jgi:hypothetical protein
MHAFLDTAGERLAIECSLSWVMDLIAEGAGGALQESEVTDACVTVRVDADRQAFPTRGWDLLARGVWQRNGELVIENACTAGFDVHLRCTSERAEFTYRWRPPARDRGAAWVLRSRFHLLARAMLTQYPVLWWAGTRDRAPLHASACVAGGGTPLVTAPSGVGRSTLVLAELRAGGQATGDNLAVGDGSNLWGLIEPLRVKGGSGRRMPHGRNEIPIENHVDALVPDSVVVLKRGHSEHPFLSPCSSEAAARSLVTSTYMAGELRRYWPFAAMLAAATGLGPSHPPVAQVASAFAGTLPCFSLALGHKHQARLLELLTAVEVAA